MKKFNIQLCPVCDKSEFALFLTCTDYFVSGEEFKIKLCKTCGFKITENIENEENIAHYYKSENYISHSNTTKGLVNVVYHQVRKYMLGRKRRLIKKVTALQKGHILDIGTGTGFFLNEMRKSGWQVKGIEKSEDARKFAESELNLINQPSEELFNLKDKSYDVISLWHVLEHIHQLNKYMDEFFRLLKDHGKLVIAIPNHTSYDAKHYKEFWAAYDVPRHIWHFAPDQIKLLGEKHGFKLNSLHTMPFDSFYVSMLSEKYKKSSFGLLKGVFHGKISWLTCILSKTKCSSVIYVFEKN